MERTDRIADRTRDPQRPLFTLLHPRGSIRGFSQAQTRFPVSPTVEPESTGSQAEESLAPANHVSPEAERAHWGTPLRRRFAPPRPPAVPSGGQVKGTTAEVPSVTPRGAGHPLRPSSFSPTAEVGEMPGGQRGHFGGRKAGRNPAPAAFRREAPSAIEQQLDRVSPTGVVETKNRPHPHRFCEPRHRQKQRYAARFRSANDKRPRIQAGVVGRRTVHSPDVRL